ncbi:hypothetical protein BDN72DRAFT_839974 [Pluteus cervinus]|uniref:Uncharacterized protein n=1 Tax=Pluteus cervinus TaxID=181527 RepID=A0ACD3AW76_9AGAR|nr:hypothetical protein BDN72DRAFT_839974 [Pluteus cervinus]
MSPRALHVHLQDHFSAARTFFHHSPKSREVHPPESSLLKAIRTALRGRDTESSSEVRSEIFELEGPDAQPEELTWDAHTVILSSGGIILRKWNFEDEKQPIQWATIGILEQNPASAAPSQSSSAHYASMTSGPGGPPKKSTERPTFGPFSQIHKAHKLDSAPSVSVPGVFVFLRNTGKVFLRTGQEYTFSLPFVVRRAWPLKPHGLLIQRVLESSELEEAEMTGDTLLPTIFSMTSPFAEPAIVGLTRGITGSSSSLSLLDEDEILTKPLKSVPPTDIVIWVAAQHESDVNIAVTVDAASNQISIWRYAYIPPKDAHIPSTGTRTTVRKRQSLTGTVNRRVSGISAETRERLHAMSPSPHSREQSPLPDFLKTLDVGQRGNSSNRRASLNLVEPKSVLDRITGRMDTGTPILIEHNKITATYWMEKLHTYDVPNSDSIRWRDISISLFDYRYDGITTRAFLAVCLPGSQSMRIFSIGVGGGAFKISPVAELPARSVVSISATRRLVRDLLVLKPDRTLSLYTHGLHELPLVLGGERPLEATPAILQSNVQSRALIALTDGRQKLIHLNLLPRDQLTKECLELLALILPHELYFDLHCSFLSEWSQMALPTSEAAEFNTLSQNLYRLLSLASTSTPTDDDNWSRLGASASHLRLSEDPAIRRLKRPPSRLPTVTQTPGKPHAMIAPVLFALHNLAESYRLVLDRFASLFKLVPVICCLALQIRPEWADYWRRLTPNALSSWPTPASTIVAHLDDRIPLWPPDASAVLFGRITSPEWTAPWPTLPDIASRFGISPSFAHGLVDPLVVLHQLTAAYRCLADPSVNQSQKRAENAVYLMVMSQLGPEFVDRLPLGIAAPLREAARTCQLSPPGDWPLTAYRAIGRNDLAASASDAPDLLYSRGYHPVKDFINPSRPRPITGGIINETKASANGEIDDVSGVELGLRDFTDIRFGQDKRLEEVARMLCSSIVTSTKIAGGPELSEHDQAKEHQNQVVRTAERTLALPYGRAMYTFGSVQTVTREAYAIPRMEYTIRLQPLNIVVPPEPTKIPLDSQNWGQFHNGVAAGLRIAPSAEGIESSWIAFNKPSDLTPEHAGFLFALGLTGHLKEMLTWHTFGYLTPKHDLTSIGVLLGLAAANIGSSNQHVTKLLAVHTPALLPTPSVDLNVSLMTQAAGLAGIGLLYLGTKHRRMAEVCLNQISRKDLVQPDLSNEHRDAYTYAAGLAFGMVMLGKGTAIPADLALISRLNTLIHGESKSPIGQPARQSFDLNLTSPAATIALGLMYLRTERQDIADIVTIPDTVVSLNRIQPSFLLLRTIARSLIMWQVIAPTQEWIQAQIPKAIRDAMDNRTKTGKATDDAMELAYYNIVAGCCFVIGLKYAGTARQEAYAVTIRYFDLFTRLVYSNGPAYDHKIKRSAVRDGLNLISISLSMIMAGTGEITCFRRLRYAYGMYQQAMHHHNTIKYGIHVATHLSIGLLFLGGGKFTLGTSDAAIACMVTAFFPRFHQLSSDNKSYLQALRHLWVLAVEPRCLIARDVDTTEVVYLPVKIAVKDGNELGTTQLISPTLIPDLDKLTSLRVDTPRYWPFYLDTQNLPQHKETLLRSQTLYVKRRTAFLSYTEDPRGSRSLFVRSGSSAGDAAILDFPQLTDTRSHPASDLSEFITSFSNDTLFLSFADHFSREDGDTPAEQLFHTYCHASLLDSILQDKPQTLQSHLTLFRYRRMEPTSRYFHLRLQDLRFATDFYCRVYDRRFSGRAENNPRPPLLRESTVLGAQYALDQQLDRIRSTPRFLVALGKYARGEVLDDTNTSLEIFQKLAWYLLRDAVPVSTILVVLKDLAREAHVQCFEKPPPGGTSQSALLEVGIREVLHATGTRMTQGLGAGWDVRSLDEIIQAWQTTE